MFLFKLIVLVGMWRVDLRAQEGKQGDQLRRPRDNEGLN